MRATWAGSCWPHGEVYAQEFGWDVTFEALVARIVADYADDHDPAREAAWIAEVDGHRVGCVFCVADRDTGDVATAKLRILLVHPDGRGRGLGGRLVDTCVAFARANGYARCACGPTNRCWPRAASTSSAGSRS